MHEEKYIEIFGGTPLKFLSEEDIYIPLTVGYISSSITDKSIENFIDSVENYLADYLSSYYQPNKKKKVFVEYIIISTSSIPHIHLPDYPKKLIRLIIPKNPLSLTSLYNLLFFSSNGDYLLLLPESYRMKKLNINTLVNTLETKPSIIALLPRIFIGNEEISNYSRIDIIRNRITLFFRDFADTPFSIYPMDGVGFYNILIIKKIQEKLFEPLPLHFALLEWGIRMWREGFHIGISTENFYVERIATKMEDTEKNFEELYEVIYKINSQRKVPLLKYSLKKLLYALTLNLQKSGYYSELIKLLKILKKEMKKSKFTYIYSLEDILYLMEGAPKIISEK